ncbi:DUF1801 domain-containing protein [Streptacidiphilus sp. MAP5-3]|uniref:DUF1801 domain-containing protein n=1 Tax=unclassified Streptacidiphilus TaxID=2643834 RepID=UPI003517D185
MTVKKAPTLTPTEGSVAQLLEAIADPAHRTDAAQLCALMRAITGEEPTVWGGGIVGFGSYDYRYASGHEGTAPLAGFAPRRQHLVVYLAPGFVERHPTTLARLGPHQASKGCLYLRTLIDVNFAALRQLIAASVQERRTPVG